MDDVYKKYKLGPGCLCGHFDSCIVCENIDWARPGTEKEAKEQDYVVAIIRTKDNGDHRRLLKRNVALTKGFDIEELDL